jgi:electron transport complex protein RnfG
MSIWATSSKLRLSLGWALGLGLLPSALQAQLTRDEALRAAFPLPATIERRTAFLSAADLEAARQQAGPDVPVTQRVVTYYLARIRDSVVGVAYFDSHRVRTLNEVLMIVVVSPGRIRNIEVLRFAEPPEYHATEPWLEQFRNQSLSAELSLKGSIRNLTGATLTSNAIVRAARRVLALHARIHPFSGTQVTTP